MKPIGFHEGDRSEYLAAYAFDTIGYSVPVPRQQDRFLVDMFVHLAEDSDAQLHVPTGIVFGVQIKSDNAPIGVRPEHVTWLARFGSPLFICVVSKSQQTLDVYQTLGRIPAVHHPTGQAIAFHMGGTPPEQVSIGNETLECQPIDLGEAIVHISLNDLDDQNVKTKRAHRSKFFRVMQGWALLEMTIATWRHSHLPFIAVPPYETNRIINFNDFQYATYGSQNDLQPACAGLGAILVAFEQFLKNDVLATAQGTTREAASLAIDHIEGLLIDLQSFELQQGDSKL